MSRYISGPGTCEMPPWRVHLCGVSCGTPGLPMSLTSRRGARRPERPHNLMEKRAQCRLATRSNLCVCYVTKCLRSRHLLALNLCDEFPGALVEALGARFGHRGLICCTFFAFFQQEGEEWPEAVLGWLGVLEAFDRDFGCGKALREDKWYPSIYKREKNARSTLS